MGEISWIVVTSGTRAEEVVARQYMKHIDSIPKEPSRKDILLPIVCPRAGINRGRISELPAAPEARRSQPWRTRELK